VKRSLSYGLLILALVLGAGAHAFAQAPAVALAPAPPPAEAAAPTALNEEDLLLFEVRLGELSVTDSLPGYQVEDNVLLPIGELARLLDMDVVANTGERRVRGTIGAARRSLIVDLNTLTARVGAQEIALKPGEFAVGRTDIYFTPEAMSRLLPMDLKADSSSLVVEIQAREKLPIQLRLERLNRIRQLTPDVESRNDALQVASPYRALSWPSLDLTLETAIDTRPPKRPYRYDVRLGGDLLWTNFQAYVGSDNAGQPSVARLLLERMDPRGGLLGPIHATRISGGDTFTPALPIGPRSVAGRGLSLTNQALQQASVFQRIDLRGELPLGYDVELYVNDILRGGQETPVLGRYEFLNVPLVRGLNVIRIVSYSPQGDRSEEVSVISVGGGALAKGDTVLDFGAVQQDRNVLIFHPKTGEDVVIPTPGDGDPRVALSIAHGLFTNLTVVAAGALYTPITGIPVQVGSLGVRTSLFGMAVQADLARDDRGGEGMSVGFAGQPFGVSIVGRHAEFRNGFVDESTPAGPDARGLLRHSEVSANFSLPAPGDLAIPLSLTGQYDAYVNGDQNWVVAQRFSSAIGSVSVSGGLDYRLDRSRLGVETTQFGGVVSATSFIANAWQVRGNLDFDLVRQFEPRSVGLTVDRSLSETIALRFGIGHSLTGERTTNIAASTVFRLKFFDLQIGGDYSVPAGDWRIGARMAFSLMQDPLNGRYMATRPGAAAGGNLAMRAFVDRNGNDRMDPGEDPVPGIIITGGGGEIATDAKGQALVTGIGAGSTAQLRLNLNDIDFPYVASPPQVLELTPRPGGVARLDYALKPTGEVLVRIMMRDANGRRIGISAVDVVLTRPNAPPVRGRTEFDGSVLFDKVSAGSYTVTLDPDQSKRLGMSMTAPATMVVPPDGGFVPDVNVEVVFAARQ
jgi:hypothetical protein